jgi:hypothetical protein
MVGPARASSHNSSSRYPTIRGSEVFDARTPSNRIVWNMNPDFNVVRLQTIMESIQRMVPHDSPLVALAQQGDEAVGQIVVAEPSTGYHRGEPSISNRSADRTKHAQSEEASSSSGNICLGDNDERRWITQNLRQREYGHDLADLCNIIDDRRCLRTRTTSPPQRSPVRVRTPSGRGVFRVLAPGLNQVTWPDKLKSGPINKYDDPNNPK